ncbi:MAG: toll/interleukin-1 receptor domain-containing protein [Lachnospiraceae bacterium]|nr:toll/interleukin-1 receptor domain-containing protein [Lachnospiraceae bacterium]
MKDVFISFSSQNMDEAVRICDFLESSLYSCFLASRDITPGAEYASQLVEQLSGAKCLVLLLSVAANESPHVLREIEYCVSHRIPIIVYPLEEVKLSKSLEYFLMTHQWLSMDSNKDERLIESLERLFCAENKASGENSNDTNAKSPVESVSVSLTDDEGAKDKSFYDEMIRNTKKAYGKAFLLMILVVILLFGAMFYRYILPDIKNSGVASTNDSAVTSGTDNLAVKEVKLSDTITFGRYNDEDIDWRVIHINDDGSAVLLSSQILTIKAFDTAEGGKYNDYDGVDYWSYENHIIDDPAIRIMARGNNDWSLSNIRTWLNSDKEVVEYNDQAPTKSASCVGENFYSNEPGFLFAFTDGEKEAILVTHNETIGNCFSNDGKGGSVLSDDLVYLLSEKELSYLKDAGISIYASVTDKAALADTSGSVKSFNDIHGISNYYWWLRDHDLGADENIGKIVLTEYEDGDDSIVSPWSVGASSYGIRPAITVDIKKLP